MSSYCYQNFEKIFCIENVDSVAELFSAHMKFLFRQFLCCKRIGLIILTSVLIQSGKIANVETNFKVNYEERFLNGQIFIVYKSEKNKNVKLKFFLGSHP